MSDIQLSPQLIQTVQQAVQQQHPGADTGVILQYLAAISGYLLGSEQGMQGDAKQAFLSELCAFAGRVYQDVQEQQGRQQAAAAQQAFGYWEPPR